MSLNKTKALTAATVCAITSLAAIPRAHAVDLIGVHDLAVQNDPALLSADARREATGENPRQALANLLPDLRGSAGLTKGNAQTSISGVEISDTDTDNENLGLDLIQSLYDYSNYKALEIAEGQVGQAEADYQFAYQEFLLRVAQRYFDVLQAQDDLTFSIAEEEAFKRQYEQAEQRFEVGLTAITDVHEARASYDRARARKIVSENILADTLEGLRELTGRYFDDVDRLEEDLPLEPPRPASPDDWIGLGMQSNPSLLSARYGVEVAEANVKFERGSYFPTLEGFASYSEFTNNEFILRDDNFQPIGTTDLQQDDVQYGIRLRVPLYQGGRVSSRTRQAGHLLDAQMQDEEGIRRNVVRNIENTYRGVIAGIEQVLAFRQALVSAESALEATQAGFEVGTRTIVDVLLAQQRYYQAQRDLSLVRHQYILDHLRLKASAGLLAEQDLRVVNTLLE